MYLTYVVDGEEVAVRISDEEKAFAVTEILFDCYFKEIKGEENVRVVKQGLKEMMKDIGFLDDYAEACEDEIAEMLKDYVLSESY